MCCNNLVDIIYNQYGIGIYSELYNIYCSGCRQNESTEAPNAQLCSVLQKEFLVVYIQRNCSCTDTFCATKA